VPGYLMLAAAPLRSWDGDRALMSLARTPARLLREFRIRRNAVAGAGDRPAEVSEGEVAERWPNPQGSEP
jgi:hypothetical protein